MNGIIGWFMLIGTIGCGLALTIIGMTVVNGQRLARSTGVILVVIGVSVTAGVVRGFVSAADKPTMTHQTCANGSKPGKIVCVSVYKP